jgi:hypothetical protein
MTEENFREVALGFAGAIEGSHMGHPDFRANGRVFAALHGNDTTGMVKLTPDQQTEFQRDHPKMFEPASGAWGRQGYTKVTLRPAKPPAVRSAMLLAYQGVMAMPKPKARKRR